MQALKMEHPEPPIVDERTAFWLQAFNLIERCRPYTSGNPLPLHPGDVLDLAERLRWPACGEEALSVVQAMDDAVLEHVRKK